MTTTPIARLPADRTVGEIVADDYRTAAVFERHGIDFCCGGRTPLTAACQEKGIDPAALAREIETARSTPVDRSQNFTAWTLSFLADYIVNAHHTYLKENTPKIAAYARKIAQVHGPNHPEVVEIAGILDRVAAALTAHLREEEEVFFPAIKRVETSQQAGRPADANDLQTLQRSLQTLSREHEEIGDATHRIRHLAQGYAVPPDVCNTFSVTYHKLKEFEDDLHKHVHLENNILFPKALQLQ
jgi:regulator of cell morphogenesis and NO signaling